MDRRRFLSSTSALIAGVGLSAPALISVESKESSIRTAFHKALKEKPLLRAFLGTDQKVFQPVRLDVTGTLPADLKGTLYRNGPARHEIGDFRYHHWFDGDGMIQAFNFEDGTITHKARFVETAKLTSELAAGRALYSGFGTPSPAGVSINSPDQINVANINIIRHAEEMLALWEGGSAHIIDKDSLMTQGIKNWGEGMEGLPFSAHPRLDANGTLWNFGFAHWVGMMIIYRIDPDGTLVDKALVPLEQIPMVHDFMVTDSKLVFVLPPYYYSKDRDGSFLDHFSWQGEQQTGHILVIDKNDLSKQSFYPVPAYWVFHFANAFDDQDVIEFDFPKYKDTGIVENNLKHIMSGVATPFSRVDMMRARLNLKTGNYNEYPLLDGYASVEFPRIHPADEVKRHGLVLCMGREKAEAPMLNRVILLDRDRGEIGFYDYGADSLAEEHIIVPRPGSDNPRKGWVIGTSLDSKANQSVISVFDLEGLSDGPLAQARLPYLLPHGLHGNFVSA